ncbi:GntR family transcriptional regulator [Aquamicrobium sp.]|uniref:GntR family transcriptional regulator n=1 Tax=Aquamicrobium sp. TaxID=1872579 RepID=UPI0025843327|nr:GntR family transcriptional regulator [Aquamicrobium sp.]MCK9549731.1 GntR family transcriptional regulator [Aquamicrobium sp.]
MSRLPPLHLKISDELRRRISQGFYDGEDLPPEIQLMQEFQCSRHTMRSALQHLVSEGLIERRAGSGTRITDRARGGIWAVGVLGNLIGEFQPEDYLTLVARIVPASDHEEAALVFGIPPESQLFYIMRLLLAQGVPYALADVFTRPNLTRNIPQEAIGTEPLIQLVEKYGRVRSVRVRQVATAAAAGPTAARQLGMAVGDPVLILKRTYFDARDHAILHTSVSARPDRYCQEVDFLHESPA